MVPRVAAEAQPAGATAGGLAWDQPQAAAPQRPAGKSRSGTLLMVSCVVVGVLLVGGVVSFLLYSGVSLFRSSLGPEWVRYDYPKMGVSARFNEEEYGAPRKFGVRGHLSVMQGKNDEQFALIVSRVPPMIQERLQKALEDGEFEKKAKERQNPNVKMSNVTTKKRKFKGHPAVYYEWTGRHTRGKKADQRFRVRGWQFMAGDRMIMISWSGPSHLAKSGYITGFFNSLELSEPTELSRWDEEGDPGFPPGFRGPQF